MENLNHMQATAMFEELKNEIDKIEGHGINWEEVTNLDQLKEKVGGMAGELG